MQFINEYNKVINEAKTPINSLDLIDNGLWDEAQGAWDDAYPEVIKMPGAKGDAFDITEIFQNDQLENTGRLIKLLDRIGQGHIADILRQHIPPTKKSDPSDKFLKFLTNEFTVTVTKADVPYINYKVAMRAGEPHSMRLTDVENQLGNMYVTFDHVDAKRWNIALPELIEYLHLNGAKLIKKEKLPPRMTSYYD